MKLSDIADFNPKETIKKGTIAKKVPMDVLRPFCRDIPCYKNENFSGGTKFRNGDTIMARITPCLENGKTAQVSLLDEGEVGFGSTEYIVFRAKEGIADKDYLYYLICSSKVRDQAIKSMVGSSGRQRVQTDVVKNIEVELPSLAEQEKIAYILRIIDDKIALNERINENLLEQATALFDNALQQSESISFVELGSLADVKGGKRLPKGVNLITKPNSHPYIRVRDLNNMIFASLSSDYEYVDDETQKSIARYITSAGDVLVSIVGTIGLTAIVDDTLDNANLTENCVKLTNLKGITPEYLLLFLRSKIGVESINKGTVGAVQLKLPIKNIQSIPVPLLMYVEMQALSDILSIMFNRISANIIETKRLYELRDVLLPKLISGELSVSDINY